MGDLSTLKLAAAIDRFHLNIRDFVRALQAVVEGPGYNCGEDPINKYFI